MKFDTKWILLIALGVLVWSMQGTLPKEAVADVNGRTCAAADDCPCWGTYIYSLPNETAYGLGKASCLDCSDIDNRNETGCAGYTTGMHCDMTWCYDVEPVADWAKDHPWDWMKKNTIAVLAIVGALVLIIMWPKQ